MNCPLPGLGEGSGARITLVTTSACHLCHDAQVALASLTPRYAMSVIAVSADSEQGHTLVAEHRPALFPLTLVDGADSALGGCHAASWRSC